jgi:flavin-dependent dehydrogenase
MLNSMPAQDLDAIIAGASFAGLAVARELRGQVLLVDRHEVGAVQTSACGTPLWLVEDLGLRSSVLEVHDRLTLAVAGRTITYDLSAVPFCTFDYRAFCRGLLEQSRCRFLRAAVLGLDGQAVLTSEGRFSAPVIVDCSGWRGVLVRPGSRRRPAACSFGLETHAAVDGHGLGFFVDRRVIPRGLGWIFPVGAGSLVGLGSYAGRSRLRPALERLLAARGADAGSFHGTYFPSRLAPATRGSIFAVGDAAGQCLPLTAEGIRPAIYFGAECGRRVQRVLDGASTLGQALGEYRVLVRRYRRVYGLLRWAQWAAAHAPAAWLAAAAELAGRAPYRARWWPRYGLFGRLHETPAGCPA